MVKRLSEFITVDPDTRRVVKRQHFTVRFAGEPVLEVEYDPLWILICNGYILKFYSAVLLMMEGRKYELAKGDSIRDFMMKNKAAINQHLNDPSYKEMKIEFPPKITAAVFKHISENLPEKLEAALHQLINEANLKFKREASLDKGFDIPSLTAKDATALVQGELKRIKRRLELKGRGGARRRRRNVITDEVKLQYARTVNDLREKWKFITDFFKKNDYESECLNMLRARNDLKDIPPDLIKRAFNRRIEYAEEGRKISFELSPLAFALEHASRVLDIKNSARADGKYSISRLDDFYREGKNLLPVQSNSSRKSSGKKSKR